MIDGTENDTNNEQSPLLPRTRNVSSSSSTSTLLTRKRQPTPLPKLQLSILLLLQLCEPIVSQVIYPFIAQLITELGVTGGDKRKVGYYAGIIESVFFVAEAITVLQWSRVSDYVGRKPVLLTGLAGLGISTVSFGLSRTFSGLVISRCLAGILNGNIGVMKSMMGEITDESNRADGFALMPIVWSAGTTIGPLIGGSLARPHDRFPKLFGANFWKTYPYFLPCAVSATFVTFSFLITLGLVKETVHTHKAGLGLSKVSAGGAIGDNIEAVTEQGVASNNDMSQQKNSGPVPLRDLLIFRVVISVMNYGSLAFLDIALNALFPLFYALPIEIGGLGFPPSTIGLCLGAVGFANGMFQVFFFAKIVRRFGPKAVFCTGISSFVPIFSMFPLISSIAKRSGVSTLVWILLAIQLMIRMAMDMSFGTIFIYITSAAPNRRSLGATNGLSQTTVAIARAIGPAMTTSAFSFSAEHSVLDGYAVYLLLVVASGFAILLAARLPTQLWKREDEEEDDDC